VLSFIDAHTALEAHAMRRFLSALILLLGLAFCPDLTAGQWHSASVPSADEQAEIDEAKRERLGLYFVGMLAAIIGVVVAVQFCREARQSFPSGRTYLDEFDSAY
jgi:hypothetical protein